MQPTIEILDRIRKNSRDNKEEIFTRLYRYLLRPDLYYLAYKNLYANKGAGTKGVNDDTADGFSFRYAAFRLSVAFVEYITLCTVVENLKMGTITSQL